VTWTVDLASSVPPSRQLVEAALDALSSGRLAAGDRLPSVRGLAAAALVNHNTVARAYRDLEQRGVVKQALIVMGGRVGGARRHTPRSSQLSISPSCSPCAGHGNVDPRPTQACQTSRRRQLLCRM
jgi:DNA-binding transcriptional MocR family regulator